LVLVTTYIIASEKILLENKKICNKKKSPGKQLTYPGRNERRREGSGAGWEKEAKTQPAYLPI